MDVKKWVKELMTPPKSGKGSSGTGSGMLDDTARKVMDRKKKQEELLKKI